MKALEKDRKRRYQTANDFAADLRRYLRDEPVEACPPSMGYRLRKFGRRNKAALGVATLVIFSLMLLGAGVGWMVRDQAARQKRIGAQVESILAEVDRLQREQKWPEALAAAQRANALATSSEADADTTARVREQLKDLEFIDRLEEIRMQTDTREGQERDYAGADRAYAKAFRDYGVDIDELTVETSIDRLKTRPKVVVALAAALDEWFQSRWKSRKETADWQRLVAVARDIDPEPLRDRMRTTFGKPTSEVQDELGRIAGSIDISATHPTTIARLAAALTIAERKELAIRLRRNALLVHPGDFWLNLRQAEALNDQKDYDAAVRYNTAALAIRPNAVIALNNLGVPLLRQGKVDDALAVYRRAIELDPKYALTYVGLGHALYDEKQVDEAIAACRKAIELDPNLAAAYNHLGNILHEQKQMDEAIAAYRNAIELDPDRATNYINLGNVLRGQNRLEEAIASYRKAIELDPNYATAYFTLVYLLTGRNKLDEAITAYRKAIEVDPNYGMAYTNLGYVLELQNKMDEAVVAYRKAIEVDPEADLAYGNLSETLAKQDKHEEALAVWRKTIDVNPKAAFAFSDFGRLLCDQGKWDDAFAVFCKAIELDPENPDLLMDRARLNGAKSSWDAAAADWVQVLELSEDGPGFSASRKVVGRELAEDTEAFRRVAALRPDVTALWIGRGQYFALRSQWVDAAENYAKAVASLTPDDESIFEYAGSLLLAGDKKGYAYFCEQLARSSAEPHSTFTSFVLARTCGIGPAETIDPKQLVDWATERLQEDQQPWVRHVLGLAQYRADEFALAIETLEKSNTGNWSELAKAQDWFLLALAHEGLDHRSESREWFIRAKQAVEAARPANANQPVDVPVPDWIELQLLLRETETVFNSQQLKQGD
jgi:tetratricopeptide (TPR) repeat protein